MLSILLLAPVALSADLNFAYPTTLGPGEKPALYVTPIRAVSILAVDCEVGGRTWSFEKQNQAGGKRLEFTWERNTQYTHAECTVQARFTDDTADGAVLSMDYSYGEPLHVDLSRASADVKVHTLTVPVTARVDTATVIAYGVGKAEIGRQTMPINAGPGSVVIPWVGEPDKVVLLDVTVTSGGAWSNFTFSPWFLDIPHQDVLFATDQSVVTSDEEWKLAQTLQQLQDTVALYGDIVPVKLFVAGCTDTVGDGAHNLDLSRRRALAIARWLRDHGFAAPIHYYGFGEGLPASPTGDNVDSAANRRALYIVASNPPPAGSGIPSVTWLLLQ